MLFREFRRNYLAVTCFRLCVFTQPDNSTQPANNKDCVGDCLDSFTVDYRTDKHVDDVLDLYALNAQLVHVSHNSAYNMIDCTVTVDINHPLFKFSRWGEK